MNIDGMSQDDEKGNLEVHTAGHRTHREQRYERAHECMNRMAGRITKHTPGASHCPYVPDDVSGRPAPRSHGA